MKRLSIVAAALTLLALFSVNSNAATSAKVEAEFSQRITSAQKTLSATEQRISKERAALAREINRLERDVRALEKESAAARRLEDEKNLSLSKMQERLDGWITQRNYQNNLIQQFLRQQGADLIVTNSAELTTEEQLGYISKIASTSESWLEPRFTSVELAQTNGEIATAAMLDLGPVKWAITENTAYTVNNDAGEWLAVKALSSEGYEALNLLMTGAEAELAFDPSLSNFDQIPEETILNHLEKGGVWALPILMFALIALVIGILKAIQLMRLPQIVSFTPAALRNAVASGKSAFTPGGMQQGLFDIAREIRSPRERDDQLFLQLQEYRVTLEKRLTAIAITASVAPLLGLLGTVSGMIETFRMMTLFGSGNPEVVSGGISQALITTELGLVVAIPALIVHSLLSRKARAYYLSLENFAVLLSQDSAPEVSTPPREVASA